MLAQPRIIVATDFSECSDHALKAAEKIRRLTKGEVHVVHVATMPAEPEWYTTEASAAMLPATFRQDLLKNFRKSLDHQVKSCEVVADKHVVEGHLQKTLSRFVRDLRGDLLIMGHKGRGGIAHLMGGTTTKMVSTNEVPLLVVNRPFEVKRVSGLIETEHPVKGIFSATEELGFLFGAEIEFVSVWQDIGSLYTGPFAISPRNNTHFTEEEIAVVTKTMEERIRENMDPHSKAKIRTEVVRDRSVSGALTRILEEDHVDVAVLSRSRQNFIEKMFIGSVARRILDSYGGNFLVLPPGEGVSAQD